MQQRTVAGAVLAITLLMLTLTLRMAAGASAAVPAALSPSPAWPAPLTIPLQGAPEPTATPVVPLVNLAGLPAPAGRGRPRLESALDQLLRQCNTQSAGLSSTADRLGVTLEGDAVRVMLQVNEGSTATVATAAAALGAQVEGMTGSLVEVLAPLSLLNALADLPGVGLVRRPLQFIRQSPQRALVNQAVAYTGAGAWHAAGYRGQGAKIAVVDLGFTGYRGLMGTELPANVQVKSFSRSGLIDAPGNEHGTGVAELVYDMAPDATLYLVNFTTEVDLGRAIEWASNERVQIIVFSLGHTSGPFDGTDSLDVLVDASRSTGILWVSAAGNQAEGHWYGAFTDTSGDGWLEWAPGVKLNHFKVKAGEPVFTILTWDEWPLAKDDYAVYLFLEVFPGQLNLVSYADTVQRGQESPIEVLIGFGLPRGDYFMGVKRLAGTRPANLQLFSFVQKLDVRLPGASIAIPATARGAFTVGATNDGKDTLEDFSAQGPTVDGRMKPDITAPDRVDTISFGPAGFEGTSAAAPLVGGAAALVLSAYPWMTPDVLQGYLEGRALDLGAPGKDAQFGAGRLRLGPAPADFPPQPTSTPIPSPTVTPTWTPAPATSGTPTATRTATPTPLPTMTPTRTATPTRTPVPTPAPWPIETPTPVAVASRSYLSPSSLREEGAGGWGSGRGGTTSPARGLTLIRPCDGRPLPEGEAVRGLGWPPTASMAAANLTTARSRSRGP